MSDVTVNTTKNTVEVIDAATNVVEVNVAGPQGEKGEGFDIALEHSGKVNNSVMYYDESSGKVKLDATTTKLTLVNGGNF